MQTLIALLVAAGAACALARPHGPTTAPLSFVDHELQRLRGMQPPPPPRAILANYLLPRVLLPHYMGYDDSPVVAPSVPENDWLSKEINRISQMDAEDLINPYEADLLGYSQDAYLQNMLESPLSIREPYYSPDSIQVTIAKVKPMSLLPQSQRVIAKPQLEVKREPADQILNDKQDKSNEAKKEFALTPMDEEYYKPVSNQPKTPSQHVGHHEGGELRAAMLLEPPRQTRQNPNLGKQKHLLEPDIGKLKTGLANMEYRLPVSLLPTNLHWLKVNQPNNVDDDQESGAAISSHEEGDSGSLRHVNVLEPAADPAYSMYSVALIAAVGAALTMALVGFAFGWYTLSKKAKAAADVDYPAYGVTGPTMDPSGDRKLAHSAHMYHYQHQKQQIIAMERNGIDQRAGSISDPESEEENEEGDYTVYECPGFATTGDMEVKNPLFSEDPLPIPPGKCEVVKPQPKD